MMLGRRGYAVALAERSRTLGGRVARERRLPGLSAWGRVADYRIAQLEKLDTVEIFRESDLTANDILSFGFENVVIATGSRWRSDGIGRHLLRPVPIDGDVEILTPDALLDGARPRGKNVVIYDDDHYYMGGVLAELLVKDGCSVTLVTPAALVSIWMQLTMEQHRVQARLMDLGVKIVPQHAVTAISENGVETTCLFTNKRTLVAAESVVMVTARLPENKLAAELEARRQEWAAAGLDNVSVVGDALAPGTIAAAVFGGRRYAEELDAPANESGISFRREVASLSTGPLPWTRFWEPDTARRDGQN
jgi:dimethylamine/trimethylamine dehydrogenase